MHPKKRAGVHLGRVTVGLRGPIRGHTNAAVSHKMERGREAAVSHKEERDRKAAGRAVEGKAARVAVRDREAAGGQRGGRDSSTSISSGGVIATCNGC